MKFWSVAGLLLTASIAIECSLISQCPQGHRKPLKGHCAKYLECVNNSWQEIHCTEPDQNFDERTNTCRDRREVKCAPICGQGQVYDFTKDKCVANFVDETRSFSLKDDAECVSGSVEPDSASCRQFYRCVNGKRVEEKCWFFERFDPQVLNCVYMWNTDCKLGNECKSGDKVPSGNCREYYQCEFGFWKRRNCGTSIGLPMYFDVNSKDCMIVGSTCSSAECSVEGLKRDLPTDCSKYQVCHQGHFYEMSCGWLQKYDSDRNECRYVGVDCTGVQNLPNCANGERESVDGSCYSYRECVDGHFETRYCLYPLYRFDKGSQTCNFMGTCNKQCFENEVLPVGGRCDQFFMCTKGVYQIQTCPPNNVFDIKTLSCLDPKYATCGTPFNNKNSFQRSVETTD